MISLHWRHNGLDSVSIHQPHHCLLSRLFGHRSKKTSKLRVTGLCAGNSPGTGEFPAQMASYAENVSIWWRHHVKSMREHRAWPLYTEIRKFPFCSCILSNCCYVPVTYKINKNIFGWINLWYMKIIAMQITKHKCSNVIFVRYFANWTFCNRSP